MAVKFQTNIPQTLTFEFADPKEENGQYGLQYMYTVQVDGVRNWLYATPKLNEALKQVGVAQGVTFIITKIESGTTKGWRIQSTDGKFLYDGAKAPTAPAVTPTATTTPTAPTAPPAHAPASYQKPAFNDLAKLMERCLVSAQWAWNKAEIPNTSDNVQATASTLFICAEKNGLWREAEVPIKPPPPPPPPPQQPPDLEPGEPHMDSAGDGDLPFS